MFNGVLFMFNRLTNDNGLPSGTFFNPEDSQQRLPSIQSFIESLPPTIGQSIPALHTHFFSHTPGSAQSAASSAPDQILPSLAMVLYRDMSTPRTEEPFQFVIPIPRRPGSLGIATDYQHSVDVEPAPHNTPISRKRDKPETQDASKRLVKRGHHPKDVTLTLVNPKLIAPRLIVPNGVVPRSSIVFSTAHASPTPAPKCLYRVPKPVRLESFAQAKVIGTRVSALSMLMKQQFPPETMIEKLQAPVKEIVQNLFVNRSPLVRFARFDKDRCMVTISIKEEFDILIHGFVSGKLAKPENFGGTLWTDFRVRNLYFSLHIIEPISPIIYFRRAASSSAEGVEVTRAFHLPPSLGRNSYFIKIIHEEPEQVLSVIGNLFQNAITNYFSVLCPDGTVTQRTPNQIKLFENNRYSVSSEKSFSEELEKEIQRNAVTQFQSLKVSRDALGLKSHVHYAS